ncbi:hypothetical protein HOY34_11080 [Xinfangfangia sp. D13-10-4-6]|uniref:phage tail tube protein n=1 Tax=Pseudogemmobacter hezensis TaxID=2737662 RepID=UPI0015567B49|nr:phage tail tube protein [Pseudogemmobacter hezensis]NPD15745.1 hypothetical protein [Pseudogemmobacter hezensis]
MGVEVASRARVAWQDELWIGRTATGGGGPDWVQILGIETIAMPDRVPESIRVTHMQSPGRAHEDVPGFMESADYSQDLQDWGEDEEFLELLDDLAALTEAGTPEFVQIAFVVGGRQRTYRGYVNSFTPAGTVAEKRTAAASFKILNRITPNPALPVTP